MLHLGVQAGLGGDLICPCSGSLRPSLCSKWSRLWWSCRGGTMVPWTAVWWSSSLMVVRWEVQLPGHAPSCAQDTLSFVGGARGPVHLPLFSWEPSGPLRSWILHLGGVVFLGEGIWERQGGDKLRSQSSFHGLCSELAQHVRAPSSCLGPAGHGSGPFAAGRESGHWDPPWAWPLMCCIVVSKAVPLPEPQFPYLFFFKILFIYS